MELTVPEVYYLLQTVMGFLSFLIVFMFLSFKSELLLHSQSLTPIIPLKLSLSFSKM